MSVFVVNSNGRHRYTTNTATGTEHNFYLDLNDSQSAYITNIEGSTADVWESASEAAAIEADYTSSTTITLSSAPTGNVIEGSYTITDASDGTVIHGTFTRSGTVITAGVASFNSGDEYNVTYYTAQQSAAIHANVAAASDGLALRDGDYVAVPNNTSVSINVYNHNDNS